MLSPRHEASQAIEQAARYFRERFETGAQVSDDVRGDLAGLLKNLARTEDPEEEELRAPSRENRAITLAKGDLNAARAMVVAEEEGRKRTLNIVGMVSQSAFPAPDGGQLPTPTVTELLAIMLSKKLIVTAADELCDDLPSRRHPRDRRRGAAVGVPVRLRRRSQHDPPGAARPGRGASEENLRPDPEGRRPAPGQAPVAQEVGLSRRADRRRRARRRGVHPGRIPGAGGPGRCLVGVPSILG